MSFSDRVYIYIACPSSLTPLQCSIPYCSSMEITNPKPHLVLLSSPGLGHLIPVLELGKRLVTLCNFQVTIFVVQSHKSPAETQLLQSAINQKLYQIIQLPIVDIFSQVDPGATVVTQISIMMRQIKPAFRSAISALDFRPAAIILDLFGTDSLEIVEEFGIPKYVYIASNAWFLALTLHIPILDKEIKGEFVDQKEDLIIPGCRPVRPEDVVDPMLDRTNQQFFEYIRMGKEISKADGILLNTWEALEPKTLAAFRAEKFFRTSIFQIGPLRRPVEPIGSKCELELLYWLDNQPKKSVVYVSFGSGGTLSLNQMNEIAWGLELSQQRFIWVVRRPTIKTGDGSFFTTGNGGDDMSKYLPDGFFIRTKNFGLVVPDWSPQVQIMNHPSLGVFLSHCGWNSILESITDGVPIIAWPLYAEQRLNATLLVEELGIAVKPKILPSKGIVKREDIAKMIKRIMVDEEGIKIRKRIKEFQESGKMALIENGSSYNALAIFAKECKK